MKRPDASMSLLHDVQEGALEPEYRHHVDSPPSRTRRIVAVGLLVALLTVAALQTTRSAGVHADQRNDLLTRISDARQLQATQAGRVADLEAEIRRRGATALTDPSQSGELASLEGATGATAVTGPGITVTVDDAPTATNAQGLVLDSDLARLANGLWNAGAEAISINDQRLTTLTPIRSAGAAITVDYVSLSPPYRVQAIGDPATLQARFNETSDAVWWHYLTQNYGLSMKIDQSSDDLELPPDSGMKLRYAKRG